MASDGPEVAGDNVEADEGDEQRGGSDVGRDKDGEATRQGTAFPWLRQSGQRGNVLLHSADAAKRSSGLEVGDSAGRPVSMARTRSSVKARPTKGEVRTYITAMSHRANRELSGL